MQEAALSQQLMNQNPLLCPDPRSLRSPLARYLAWAVALSILGAGVLSARVELSGPKEEFPPTTEDLNGIAAAPSGEMIAVGEAGTVLRRVVGPDGDPVWTSLNTWAANYFSNEIFTVGYSPTNQGNGPRWVIGGRDGVVETDFTNTLEVDVRPGSGEIFTPVLATSDEIWYSVPNLGLFPSFLFRYDRASQGGSGVAFSQGPVLAICQVPGGNLRYVTTDGDIGEVTDLMQVVSLYDQDDLNPLELNAANFSEDCESIVGGDNTPLSRLYVGRMSGLRAPSAQPWQSVSRPGEPIVTSACFLTEQEHGNLVGLFAVIQRCEDGVVQTGDDITMSAVAELVTHHIRGVWLYNQLQKCQRDATATSPFIPVAPGARAPAPTWEFQVVTVGTNGRVQRMVGSTPAHYDDFEDGNLGQWAVSVP